jgi:hypothetical protein
MKLQKKSMSLEKLWGYMGKYTSMSDQGLANKFKSMASRFMNNERMAGIIQTIHKLDSLEDIGDLMKPLIFANQSMSF